MSDHKKRRRIIHYLPVYGTASTGLIYLAIGVIAVLSFLRIKQGGADEGSLLEFLNDYFWGVIVIWIILLGMLSYVTWRIYEAINDPYCYGKGPQGLSRRIGIGLSSIADAFIAYAGIRVLLGIGNLREDGQPYAQRQKVETILQESGGDWLVTGLGLVILLTAIVQFIYGVTRGYKERLSIAHFNKEKQELIHLFAWLGYTARGTILGIIGFFFIKAGLLGESRHVVNTDKAFDFIGDHVGYLPFILVAIGTICYGLFMFAMSITYKVTSTSAEEKV